MVVAEDTWKATSARQCICFPEAADVVEKASTHQQAASGQASTQNQLTVSAVHLVKELELQYPEKNEFK